MRRLGINSGGYHGQRIDIHQVLEQIRAAAMQHGWTQEVFHQKDGFEWLALKRGAAEARANVYLSSGIHGDEPAGPCSLLELLREDAWPAGISLWICPCLNPVGFTQNSRENPQGLDLNRQYRNPEADEIRAHIQWLNRQPKFDLSICVHEDWESAGFYLYEQNPENRKSLAQVMVDAVAQVCPIDPSEVIEEREAKGGIIRPVLNPQERPLWPEAVYLITHNSRQSYTLEAPSDFELRVRVAALKQAIVSAIRALE